MISSTFINEIGNKIRIKIKKQKETKANATTNELIQFVGVSITIIGPTSETENIITRQEAEELYKCLGDYLYR